MANDCTMVQRKDIFLDISSRLSLFSFSKKTAKDFKKHLKPCFRNKDTIIKWFVKTLKIIFAERSKQRIPCG